MDKMSEPRPAQFPSQKPMELPGKNTVYEPGQPGIEIPGRPLGQPEPGPDILFHPHLPGILHSPVDTFLNNVQGVLLIVHIRESQTVQSLIGIQDLFLHLLL